MRELNSTENILIIIVLGIAVAGLIYAALLARQILAEGKGSQKMQEVWGFIRTGANAYLSSQLRIIAVLVLVLVFVLFFSVYVVNPTPYAIEHFCPEIAQTARDSVGANAAAIQASVAAANPDIATTELKLLQENAVVYQEEAQIVQQGTATCTTA